MTSSTPHDDRPVTPVLQSSESILITLSISPKDASPQSVQSVESIHHDTTPPSTPQLDSAPLSQCLRNPDTLGTLIEVKDSEEKGLGIFALADIPPGTILLSEAPLVTLIDTGARSDPLNTAVDALSPERKKSFLSLHAFSRNKNESLYRSIVYSNGYSIADDLQTGVFETASRINHSCVPNSSYMWKESIGRMVWWNRFKLLAGEEVTVDYGHKKKYLAKIYGFECMCGGCTDSSGSVRYSSSSGSESGGNEEDMTSIDAVILQSADE